LWSAELLESSAAEILMAELQGLSALRHMDLQGNQLSRLEDLNLLRKYVCT
jgi:hypothetical protein